MKIGAVSALAQVQYMQARHQDITNDVNQCEFCHWRIFFTMVLNKTYCPSSLVTTCMSNVSTIMSTIMQNQDISSHCHLTLHCIQKLVPGNTDLQCASWGNFWRSQHAVQQPARCRIRQAPAWIKCGTVLPESQLR